MSTAPKPTRRLTTRDLAKRKRKGQKIVMVTAYDATFARLLDEAGVDMMLVGDSLGMVIQGHESTLPVTMDQMVYHTAAVVRGSRRALVVGDMPFLSYQVSPAEAVRNGGRLLAEAGCQAVKLEGGRRSVPAVRALVEAGIPVVGHLGLTPQSVNAVGGYRVQGRSDAQREALLADADALVEAGIFLLVLEAVPQDLAREVTERVPVPTVGIGAGPACDGQVLVCYDYLGLTDTFSPKFLKRYAKLADTVRDATATYADEVRAGAFPTDEHSF